MTDTYSEPNQTSKMDLFENIIFFFMSYKILLEHNSRWQ